MLRCFFLLWTKRTALHVFMLEVTLAEDDK